MDKLCPVILVLSNTPATSLNSFMLLASPGSCSSKFHSCMKTIVFLKLSDNNFIKCPLFVYCKVGDGDFLLLLAAPEIRFIDLLSAASFLTCTVTWTRILSSPPL